ncbi:putative aldouronate transport system permease protein [Paenibacillus taihuensis]|uniref:Putative aldouronate transport system permease protein n=1 Tax=Paenibacillus taihuensis TaxID=1156355 RepID=A0A3D9QVR6_9BACL|nr:ABC transporter permease subunit [Paenibacillus taihuensis]REE68732.1 putative aldouronate transport system permease protein [Paenibacillus taihuensis]
MNVLSSIKRRGLLPLYVFILPGLVLILLFNYIPMLGMQIAFRDYDFQGGIWGSTWVGLQNFKEFTASSDFWRATGNTFLLTMLRLLFIFPTTILAALMINEVRAFRFKRFVQSLSYLPHFISWIVVVGFLDAFLSIDGGGANSLLHSLGLQPIAFMGSETWFRPIFILSSMWKEIGWGTILYLAAITSINPVFYEAAVMDGAGRFAQMRYITLPSIVPIISIVLILTVPSLLSVGIDQIYAMINPANIGVAEVIDTYVLRLGIGQAQYSQTTAIGLVMSVMSTILLLLSNWISKRIGGDGIW